MPQQSVWGHPSRRGGQVPDEGSSAPGQSSRAWPKPGLTLCAYSQVLFLLRALFTFALCPLQQALCYNVYKWTSPLDCWRTRTVPFPLWMPSTNQAVCLPHRGHSAGTECINTQINQLLTLSNQGQPHSNLGLKNAIQQVA